MSGAAEKLATSAKMQRKTHLYGLDILRIFAASLVLLNHFAQFGWQEVNSFARGSDAAFPFLSAFAGTGAVGVEIFFVISGFVIAMSTVGTSPADFVKHRIIRVMPTLWLCATIALCARYLYGEQFSSLVLPYMKSMMLLPKGPYIDGVVWTLVVEAVFYGVVFLAMLMRSRITLDHVAIGLAIISGAYLTLYAGAIIVSSQTGDDSLPGLLNRFAFKVFLIRHGVFFAAGMLLYSIHSGGAARWKRNAVIICCVFGLIEIAISAGSVSGALARNALWIAGMVAILVSVRFSANIQNVLSGRHGFVRDLGRLSYPLYLNHYTLGMVLVPSLFAAGFDWKVVLIVGLATVLGSSWAIMRWPEAWAQKWLKQRLLVSRVQSELKPGHAT